MTRPPEFRAEDLPIPCRCGAKIAYSIDAGGRPDGVLHALPQCADFETRDPLAFMLWLKEGLQAELRELRLRRARDGARAPRAPRPRTGRRS